VAAADRFLPHPDLAILELALVEAIPERVYAAISDAEVSGDRLLGIAGGLADLEHRLLGDRVQPRRLGELLGPDLGFVVLADEPPALRALGLAARYSAFDRGVEHLDADGFEAFEEPGHVKLVVGFSVRAQAGGHALLTCDVRIRATDEDTRSTLQTTSFLVAPALRFACRRLLELVKQRAEESGAEGAQGRDGDRDQPDPDPLPAG